MAKVGRNEPCPCGSGRKFKQCCESKAASGAPPRWILLLIAAVVVAAIFAAVFNRGTEGGRGVWSPEHGHYHDASGREIPR